MELKKIKVIFIDIDGTLYTSNRKITEYSKNILKQAQEKGINIVLCSGRRCLYILNIVKQIKTSNYIIGDNGASIYDIEKNNIIYEKSIEKNDLETIYDFCEVNHIGVLFNAIKERYVNKYCIRIKKDDFCLEKEELIKKKITQIVIENIEKEFQEDLRKMLKETNLHIANEGYSTTVEGFYFMDIVNNCNNKGIAIETLLNYLNIEKSQTMCFGDGKNDIKMFEMTEINVAMENAIEELKKKATYITKNNDEDGVAYFIEKYIL